MQTRVYRGKEISRVMNQIRKDHGEDAVIVSTRELATDMIEVQVQITEMLQAGTVNYSHLDQDLLSAKAIKNLEDLCEAQGIDSFLTSRITQGYLSDDNTDLNHHDKLTKALSKVIPIDARLPFKNKFVAFIGSTGVGKTTTIAKLAARMHMAFDMKIGLISADYYRVGASYQLQTYANLMKLPYKSIDNARDIKAELEKCIEAFSSYDLVLIDAAGFSPNESERLDELSDLFNCKYPIERMLVLPAPGNAFDLERSVKKYSHVGYDRVVISKVDESGFAGPALNAVRSSGKPLAFLTNGQRVPEDIEPASHKRLARLLQRTLH